MAILMAPANRGCQSRTRTEQYRCLRGGLLALLWTALMFPLPSEMRAREDAPEEYQVKAAFLYNFARFVEWPQNTFHDPRELFTICVLGADPFGGTLEETVGQKQIDGRGIRISRVPDAAQTGGCQIVFISGSERRRVADIIRSLPVSGVLSVSEMDNFAAAGGMINFVLNEGRVRFQVNQAAAGRANLRISSRLLSLAQIVNH